jgi:hypothetical protein
MVSRITMLGRAETVTRVLGQRPKFQVSRRAGKGGLSHGKDIPQKEQNKYSAHLGYRHKL